MDATIINRYRKIQNGYQSNSKKETDLYELKRQIARSFGSSIDYVRSTKVNNTTQQLIVIHTDNEFKKNVIAYPDSTFMIGDIVDCYDMKWLVTKVDSNKQVYTIGEMSQCNLILKWQNSSGTVITRNAVAEKPSQTLDEGTVITTSDKKYSVKIPIDSETQNLHVGKRFLLEKANGIPLSYSLTSYDGISGNYGQGVILNITLTQDEYNSTTDNVDLMIADYFTPTPQPTGQAQITYTGNLTIYVGGSLKTFTAVFKDEDGNVLPDIISVWTWDTSTGDKTKFSDPVISGNTFKIKALYYPELIGSTVTINLADSEGLYGTSLEVEVIDL
jgi:hypothetical protein